MSRILGVGIALAVLAGGAGAALAQMYGSGMGSTYSPPPSAPSFNPAEEYERGKTALKAGKYKEAISAFNRVLSVAPRDSNTWALLGLSKEGAGDLKGARAAYEKAVHFNGESIVAHRLLGLADARLGDTAKAQAELEWFRKKSEACGATCPTAADLKSGFDAIQAALAPPPAAPPAAPSPQPKSQPG